MDELSIDSKTNRKIPAAAWAAMQQATQACMKPGGPCDKSRAHFRIDWRQLTYYQKCSRPLLDELLFWRQPKSDPNADPQSDQMGQANDNNDDNNDDQERASHYTRGGRKRILNSLDGSFRSGELNAIMGPSGAGKSTFLSALFGSKQDASYGQTRVTWFGPDGRPIERDRLEKGRSIRIASLPQQDHLLNHLSVHEALMFASKIKNPLQANNEPFHRANVRRVAKMLKLTDCFHTRCGRLSGGQYKRVSIGQELLSQPDVLILDEPTSGLDAMTCLTTVRTLKSIATKHPICIILTIHQPDIDVFNLFDKIYVIAQGGRAIYEGPPREVASTLAQVNLFMPTDSYNPARFIVENAFVVELDSAGEQAPTNSASQMELGGGGLSSIEDDEDEEDETEIDLDEEELELEAKRSNIITRSLSSLTEALGVARQQVELSPAGEQLRRATGCRFRDSGRRPLLNIGIQTADGKLITNDLLLGERQQEQLRELRLKEQASRMGLLQRLNQLQKEKYYAGPSGESATGSDLCSTRLSSGAASQCDEPSPGRRRAQSHHFSPHLASSMSSISSSGSSGSSASGSSSSSSSYLEARETFADCETPALDFDSSHSTGSTLMTKSEQQHQHQQQQQDNLAISMSFEGGAEGAGGSKQRRRARAKSRRDFDKRLSAKHSQWKQANNPVGQHTLLLAHRTWLSIVRDPIFFGIQLVMHTTIPILLALIFGTHQEEGCPEVGSLDLVEFAYQPNHADVIQAAMGSIRLSIGNIGVVFFEMFVLCFAINCITALVFPLDMYVLLKEYRNGWYSLRSYFFGRTLADLPVPVVLHSMAMAILCFLTSQPMAWWRFGAVIAIVILSSLVAQSTGLTIGALLMRSSQSAVLASAGIVAPFFALSGFIVRINTLPLVAQFFANCSYLFHLLNAFIILRYGFDRCPCKEEDFEALSSEHQIPANLKTMASLWIGTYSDEFESTRQLAGAHAANRTNVDPNIDVIDKLLSAFKMATSFGHKVETCADVLPYAMLDFGLKDSDILWSCVCLLLMLVVSRIVTFSAIYYKIRSFS